VQVWASENNALCVYTCEDAIDSCASSSCFTLLTIFLLRADTSSSWTAKLLADPGLLCRKVREEAGELCETLENGEGAERCASEAADLLYHAMVLLNAQVMPGFRDAQVASLCKAL